MISFSMVEKENLFELSKVDLEYFLSLWLGQLVKFWVSNPLF